MDKKQTKNDISLVKLVIARKLSLLFELLTAHIETNLFKPEIFFFISTFEKTSK